MGKVQLNTISTSILDSNRGKDEYVEPAVTEQGVIVKPKDSIHEALLSMVPALANDLGIETSKEEIAQSRLPKSESVQRNFGVDSEDQIVSSLHKTIAASMESSQSVSHSSPVAKQSGSTNYDAIIKNAAGRSKPVVEANDDKKKKKLSKDDDEKSDDAYMKAADKMVKNIEKTRKAGKYPDKERKVLLNKFVKNMKQVGSKKKKGETLKDIYKGLFSDALECDHDDAMTDNAVEVEVGEVDRADSRPSYRGVRGRTIQFKDPDGSVVNIWEGNKSKNPKASSLVEQIVKIRENQSKE